MINTSVLRVYFHFFADFSSWTKHTHANLKIVEKKSPELSYRKYDISGSSAF